MRRAVARGRVFPQSYSTDRRYGRLSLKACALFPLMWVNADDQGRLSGDHEEIKYAVCPSIDHITKADIPEILTELKDNDLIKLYNGHRSKAIQLLDWWEEAGAKLQWARPSEYEAPEGWQDRLRYKERPEGPVITENWTPKDKVRNTLTREMSPPDSPPGRQAGQPGGHLSKEKVTKRKSEIESGNRKGRGKRKRNKPGQPGERPGETSPSDLSTDRNKISNELMEQFRYCFGHYKAEDMSKFYPREPGGKELAQLRDLADELVRAGGLPLGYIREAFREAGGQVEKSKKSVSYVRAILFDWLGVEKNRSP
jgi:hypothetical protein